MSTRFVAMEGKLSADGRFIEVGALEWGPGPVPVTKAGFHNELLGKAENFVRHPDGAITADVFLFNELTPPMAYSIFTSNVEYHLDHNIMYFTKGIIRSVIVVDQFPWDDSRSQNGTT